MLLVPVLAICVLLAGCGSDPVVSTAATPSGGSPVPGKLAPRDELAARAAAAKDLRQVAFYLLKSTGRPDRTITVTRAVDGSWRVDIPGGAHGGAVDIAIVYTISGVGKTLHQCVLPASGCVRIEGALPKTADPKLQHLFSDWLALLTDRQQALAVSVAQPLEGAAGECFALESSATSLQLPLDAGVYCYERDGTLTAARLSFGTMVLAGKPGAAPPTLALPGPIVAGAPLPLAAPPTPTATATASTSAAAH
jgi:hypothetical protein